jgi:LysM repeat protein
MAANHLSPDGLITIGQKLTVTSAGGRVAQRTARANPGTVTIRAGETLSTIAVRLGVTVQSLVALNHLASPDDVQAGQTLKVPAVS